LDLAAVPAIPLALRKFGKARIVGADFAHSMLVRARAKSILGHSRSGMPASPPLPLAEADALRLPFADSSFDLVTTAFGFRNLANYEAGLREIQRVLKPGGTIAILEFTEPPAGLLGGIYRWYFCNVLPRIGGFLSGDSAAYTYLPKSVARFFRPPELASLMAAVGYHSVAYKVWTIGTVALHTAVRAASRTSYFFALRAPEKAQSTKSGIVVSLPSSVVAIPMTDDSLFCQSEELWISELSNRFFQLSIFLLTKSDSQCIVLSR
jgi:demethylmenaquinone methyltransferase/2-methoxy-6-polyprenyl-1,4-benzoquinol methylase